jgi:hypothetical protein
MGTYTIRGLCLALTLLFGVMVGSGVGVLAFLAGENVANAILTGGEAFAGATGFVLLIIGFLTADAGKQE